MKYSTTFMITVSGNYHDFGKNPDRAVVKDLIKAELHENFYQTILDSSNREILTSVTIVGEDPELKPSMIDARKFEKLLLDYTGEIAEIDRQNSVDRHRISECRKKPFSVENRITANYLNNDICNREIRKTELQVFVESVCEIIGIKNGF